MSDHGEASKNAAATTAAAKLLMEEMARERAAKKSESETMPKEEVVLEKVSSMGPVAAADNDEMDRRQRRLQEKLTRKENEIKSQAERLHKLSAELKALEEPMKAKIMEVRTRLEEINREESGLVSEVNAMRTKLVETKGELKDVRESKQKATDDLISVMASYEKRKMERLEQIAELVGDRELLEESKSNTPKARATNFGGF